MSGCCDRDCSLDARQQQQRATLLVVFWINVVMFVAIVAAAIVAQSSALLTDGLDNLGDAFTYALSLYAVSRGAVVKARVALVKGLLILVAATIVAVQILYRLYAQTVPVFEMMGLFSLIALAANGLCFFLLWRHRHEDVNMSSVWECSRNDIATNLSVFLAAGGVWLTGSGWPDLLVAAGLVILLMRSALRIITTASIELQAAP